MKILRVNMSRLTIQTAEMPDEWLAIGGRALVAKILTKEVPPDCDPLGHQSKVVFTCGPLAGTMAPSCGRLSVGAKSPLTLGIKESNSGGPAGQKLDRLGIRAIIVEGKPEDDRTRMLLLRRSGAHLFDAESFRGLKNYELAESIYHLYGDSVSIISIGTAGERQWKTAAVTVTDMEGYSARQAARGGLGAVMGAKGLKAIVLDDGECPPVEIANKTHFKKSVKDWIKLINQDAGIKEKKRHGTPSIVSITHHLGGMPVENFSGKKLEGVEKLSGESIARLNAERGGRMTGCMAGCPVKCSIMFNDKEGKRVTSGLEYATLAMMGTNLGITDPDVVARFDYLCDDMGVDSIEIGAALGVYMADHKKKMGDIPSIETLLDEIKEGTYLGSLLGNGVVVACKALGVDRIPAFKGQAIPGHDPRVTKSTGVSYLTSPMGADHTAGASYDEFNRKSGQVNRSLQTQIFSAICDGMGFCLLASPRNKSRVLTYLKNLLNARYGLATTEQKLTDIGKETLKDELAYNERSEFHAAHSTESAFFRKEKIGRNGGRFDIESSEIDQAWDRLDGIQFKTTSADPG